MYKYFCIIKYKILDYFKKYISTLYRKEDIFYN